MLAVLLFIAAIVGCKLLSDRLQYSRVIPDIKNWSFLDYLYMILKAVRPVIKAQKGKGIEQFFKAQALDFRPSGEWQTASKVAITFGGDVIDWIEFDEESRMHLWDDLGEYVFSSDIMFANLEMPIDITKPTRFPFDLRSIKFDRTLFKAPKFNGSQKTFDTLQYAGRRPDIVSTATNHCFNMEETGISNTLELLDNKGVQHVGTARTSNEQDAIPVIERNGIRVAFLAYTFSLNQDSIPAGKDYLVNIVPLNDASADISLIHRHIALAKAQRADIIVASLHWGSDQEAYPTENIINNAHTIIRAGVDIIIGHHPHILQPMEKYTYRNPSNGQEKKGLIAYSMGEFLSYSSMSYALSPIPAVWLSAVLRVEITKSSETGEETVQISRVKLLPFYKLGKKAKEGRFAVRFIDLRKTLNSLIHSKQHYNLSIQEINNMVRAHAYLEDFIYPEDATEILEPL
jgi:poly-gamma-glutamate capsule biosynthesis protein CapA/YwtB (metallophosphatase superfamily)